METVTDFIFLGSKITANGDCSHEVKKHLMLGRKAMTKLDTIIVEPQRRLCTEELMLWYWRRLLKVFGQQRDQSHQS